jgi:hypothetical protein
MTYQQALAKLAVRAHWASRHPFNGLTPWTAHADPKGFEQMLLRGRPDWWLIKTLREDMGAR